MTPEAYYKPRTLEEAFALKADHPEAFFIAGGTDLMVLMRAGICRPSALISLRHIEPLHQLTVGATTHIGAMTRVAELLEHPEIEERYPLLTAAARRLGSPQVRSVATVGGNLANASPCADTAVALLALGARIRLASPDGEREIPLDQFFVGPKTTCLFSQELVTEIILDEDARGTHGVFIKKGRVKMDIAQASLALWARVKDGQCEQIRLAAGSVGPVPLRLPEVERVLLNHPLDDDRISQASTAAEQTVQPITDIRATADYRRQLIGVFVRRALRQICTESR